MDARDISEKIKKYWMALYPKDSGNISKSLKPVKVIVLMDDGYREVRGVVINDECIELILDNE